jgi:hypothetical protein
MPTDSGEAVGAVKGGAEGRFRAWTDIEVHSRELLRWLAQQQL